MDFTVRLAGMDERERLSHYDLYGQGYFAGGGWKLVKQGGGYAGTIQAYVPDALVKRYCAAMEALFGPGCCYLLSLREQGAVRVM